MTKLFTPIQSATIAFDTRGTPESTAFGDIYFSRKNGIAESSYVFLDGNQLAQRFARNAPASRNNRWIIAETGFGTGLNFLITAALFLATAPASAHLHFVSFEKHPLKLADLQRALQALEHTEIAHFADLAEQLFANYPPFLSGLHRLHISQRITLDLHLGDVLEQLPNWATTNSRCVDAWFLDGFAPSKNPEMWQPELYRAMVVSMANQATFATFSASGDVRRGLQAVGLRIHRAPGFGRKREMLFGSLQKLGLANQSIRKVGSTQGEQLTIVGDGIAAASLLFSLRNNPAPIHLYSAGAAPGSGASGNPQGAVYPLLQADWTPAGQFFSRANAYAINLYQRVASEHCHFQGVMLLAQNNASLLKIRSIIGKDLYPSSIWQPLTQTQASNTAQLQLPSPGVLLQNAGWVEPQKLVKQMMLFVQQYRAAQNLPLTLHFDSPVSELKNKSACLQSSWQFTVVNSRGHRETKTTQQLVLATGAATLQLLPQPLLPIRPVRGQITQIKVPKQHSLNALQQVICHSGYLTPVIHGYCCIGATFDKENDTAEYKERDNASNIEQQIANLKIDFNECEVMNGRAGVRATTPDHLPMVGRVPRYAGADSENEPAVAAANGIQEWQNLWVLTGLGARGLTSAPLAAELLASLLEKRPLPCHHDLVAALAPARFAKRALTRKLSVFSG